MPRDAKLLALQRDFLRALREPIFGESRRATLLARRAGGISKRFVRTAKDWISPSARLRPVERLELYHRQYWYRILDSIAEDFPALRALLGEKTFWRVIEAYLEATPSRSYTLRHLGNRLAAFLKKNPKLSGAKKLHALELAQLEYALCDIFEAADFAPVPAAKFGQARLALQPHLRLFAFRTPADELWRRVVIHEKPIRKDELHESQASSKRDSHSSTLRNLKYVAVFRLHHSLRVERLEPEAFVLLQAIAQTGSLAKAFKRAKLGSDPETLAKVQSWFTLWTERGWLCSPDTKPQRKAGQTAEDLTGSSTDDSLLRRAEKSNVTRLKL